MQSCKIVLHLICSCATKILQKPFVNNPCEFRHNSWHPGTEIGGTCSIYLRQLFVTACDKKQSWNQKKNKLLSHSIEWRLTGSVKLYIVGAQLDGGVTGRDHKSYQAREGQHMPGIMSNQPCFRQGTHPLLQLSRMLHLQSTINDLISLGPRSLSVSVSETGQKSSARRLQRAYLCVLYWVAFLERKKEKKTTHFKHRCMFWGYFMCTRVFLSE